MSVPCISEPISWLELERHALGESKNDAAINAHLQECASCEAVASSIASDARSLPSLVVPFSALTPRRWRWQWLLPLVPALALLLFWVVPKSQERSGSGIKGGDSSVVLIREQAGELLDAKYFVPGDRFKVQVSCAPGRYPIDVSVTQDQELFHPLPRALHQCGNETLLPGAFSLQGGPARVCVTIGAAEAPLCLVVQPQPLP